MSLGIPPISDSRQAVTEDEEKATLFNNYFRSVFSPTVSNEYPLSYDLSLNKIDEIKIYYTGILKMLNGLKTDKAGGPDGIPSRVLTECSGIIPSYLEILFKTSLSSGKLPSEWKTANVVLIHKDGPKNVVQNYRPISLLCTCSKLMEHIIYSNVFSHLNKKSYLTPSQHGFRKRLSCETQLIEFYHDLAYSFDNRLQVDCIFLDFQKACDTVPHALLIHKLLTLNLPTNIIARLADYLHHRKQSVLIKGKHSAHVPVTSAVHKGQYWDHFYF